MKPRALLLAVTALATAGAAAFLAQGWLDRQRESMMARLAKPTAQAAATAVLVARKTLSAGSFVKAEDLRWQPWPSGGLDPSYVIQGKRDAKSFAGAVVRRAIVAGEPVTDARVVKPGDRSFLAAVLTPGMRAIAVPVNAHSSIAGLVLPGDRVDLILSHRFDNGGETSKREMHTASETVLTNVRVIAIDQSTDDQKAKPAMPKTATLEVTPRQVELVTVAMDLGKLSLSLRSLAKPDDDQDDAEADATADEPLVAARGNTLTRDSDVSRLIASRPDRRAQHVVHLMRGSKSAVLELPK